jgi:malate dehydrogenase
MIRAAMGGEKFGWPSGCYVNTADFPNIMMAMETDITKDGVVINETKGTDSEMAALKESYQHLAKLRDEVISMGIIPATDQWKTVNPNL